MSYNEPPPETEPIDLQRSWLPAIGLRLWNLAQQPQGSTGTPTQLLETIPPRWSRSFPETPYSLSRCLPGAQAHPETDGVTKNIRVMRKDPSASPGQNQPNGFKELDHASAE